MTAVGVPRTARTTGRPTAWWGMLAMITTESMIFAGLLGGYFFTRAISKEWPLGAIEPPDLRLIAPFTAVLLASSIPIFWVDAAVKRGRLGAVKAGLAISFLMGLAFLGNQVYEYRQLTFGIRDNAYGSLFYVITGLHGAHLVVGLMMSLVVQAKVWKGRISAERHLTVTVFSMYWHFVDVVWIFVFSSLYLSAHVR